MPANIAITPPNLLGIDRRMAYNHKKYHSGLMWSGVDSGLAGKKFSGSPRIVGANSTKTRNRDPTIKNPIISLLVK